MYFSLEAICLNSKEPNCAETENIFAFKSKRGYFFSETQASVTLLCKKKKKKIDSLGCEREAFR